MRVCLVEHAGWGGMYHYAHALGSALVRTGTDVRFVTGRGESLPTSARVDVRRPFNKLKTSPLALWRAFRSGPPVDLIHFQVATRPEAYCLLLRIVGKRPIIVTLHEVPTKDSRPWRIPFLKRLCAASRFVLVHGETPRREAERLLAIPAERLRSVEQGHYGFFAGLAASPVARDPQPTLLSFGLIEPRKGHEDLIDAFSILARRLPDCRLLIVGRPMMSLEPLRDRIRRHGLEDRITLDARFIPAEEISALFQRAWVTVLSYRETTQSAVLLLAMGHDCPVVATRVGAIPEVVRPGIDGELVPPRDPQALAAALEDLLSHPERLEGYRRAIRERRDELFSWDEIAKSTAEIYREALAEPPP